MISPTILHDIIKACLFTDEELAAAAPGRPEYVEACGVILQVGLHPGRLAERAALIHDALDQLPAKFHLKSSQFPDGGEGASFLEACMDKDGVQWGEHRDMDALLTLGAAVGRVTFPFPRGLWPMLPGGVPYVQIAPRPELPHE